MIVLNEQVLQKYWRKHPDSRKWLQAWLAVSREAHWHTIQDVQQTYPAVDGGVRCRAGSVTVFDVCGNNHRLIVSVNFRAEVIFLHELMPHSEYSKDLWKGRY